MPSRWYAGIRAASTVMWAATVALGFVMVSLTKKHIGEKDETKPKITCGRRGITGMCFQDSDEAHVSELTLICACLALVAL
jgi:hypothetical protein